MWNIMYNKNGNMLILEPENPKYYLCERFFTTEKYRAFSKLPFDEIISIDCALFPEKERILLDEKTARVRTFTNEQQILRVHCIDSGGAVPITEEVDSYAFCGYDLAEAFEISALTNCGGFDETFTHRDLNQFGLIPDFASAKKLQSDLIENNPDEEHAHCLLFAIWRKTQFSIE